MQWVTTTHGVPQGLYLFNRQVRKGQGALTPNQIFDLLGVFFDDNEEKVIKVQEFADFIRENGSQLFWFTTRCDHFTDSQYGLIAMAVALRSSDWVCANSFSVHKTVYRVLDS